MLLKSCRCGPAALTVGTLLAISLLYAVRAQSQTQQPILNSGAGQTTGSITVSVKDNQGATLTVPAFVSINAVVPDGPIMRPLRQNDGEDWEFTNLVIGAQYIIRVDALGFQTAEQFVNLPNASAASVSVRFFLVPLDGHSGLDTPAGGAILAPRARKAVQQGIKDLSANKISSAQKHLAKAVKMAPGNPGVNYLLGECWLRAGNIDEGAKYLENAISLDPKQPQALLALGRVRYQQGDMAKAIELLKQAAVLEPRSWQVHWLLGAAFLRERDYQQAREQAERALGYGKENADPAKIILAIALANLGEGATARELLAGYLKQHPNDPHVLQIRTIIQKLQQAQPEAH